MPMRMLRRHWSPKIVLANSFVAAAAGLAAIRVATYLGWSDDMASAFAGTVGYMGAMAVEFVILCMKEHYLRRAKGDLGDIE